MCTTFDASKGQAYMTTTQSNEKNADFSTRHVCNISCIVTLISEMYWSPVANVLRYIAWIL